MLSFPGFPGSVATMLNDLTYHQYDGLCDLLNSNQTVWHKENGGKCEHIEIDNLGLPLGIFEENETHYIYRGIDIGILKPNLTIWIILSDLTL